MLARLYGRMAAPADGQPASDPPTPLRHIRLSRSVTSPGPRLSRRQSAQSRINEILETGRDRADMFGADDILSPASRRSPALSIEEPNQGGDDIGDDTLEPDETTGITAQASGRSYQSMHTNSRPNRSRTSIYSRPSRDRTQAQESTNNNNNNGVARRETQGSVPQEGDNKLTWWRRPLGKFQSIELDNKGSVARDHLALERTYLAWLRTSLAFASIGIAVTQLFRLNTALPTKSSDSSGNLLRAMGRPLGATFLGISIVVLLLGAKRYFEAQDWVIKGKFPASRGTILIVTFIALAIMVLSLIVVVVIHPESGSNG